MRREADRGVADRAPGAAGEVATVADVLARMHEVDAALPPDDGAAVFNRVYLAVTERVDAVVRAGAPAGTGAGFADPATLADLDVRFARLWLGAHDAAAGGGPVPTVWEPLFAARAGGRWPLQYALAGMNAHIEHDLAVAVLETCAARGLGPDDLRADYELVNGLLAEAEAPIRRSFLDEVQQQVDDRVGPVAHVVSAWSIEKARDLTWVTIEALWALRRSERLQRRYLAAVADTVAMTSRELLLPVR